MAERGARAAMFPMFVNLAGRACVVVGGGAVAEQKIRGLLTAGARVRVIAPEATGYVRRISRLGRLTWSEREFRAGDLRGAFLVIAATNSAETHAAIFREARRRDVLCNVVDVPAQCDFYYGAVVRRGPVQIAVSTSGESPALAQRVRRELESRFTLEFGRWAARLGRRRRRVQRHEPDIARRARAAHAAVERGIARFMR